MQILRRGAGGQQRAELTSWRFEYLLGAGVDGALAYAVAVDLCWDLHALCELLDRGCPGGLAARILAPADDDEEVRWG